MVQEVADLKRDGTAIPLSSNGIIHYRRTSAGRKSYTGFPDIPQRSVVGSTFVFD